MEGVVRALPNIILAFLGLFFLFRIKKENLMNKFKNPVMILYSFLTVYIVFSLVFSDQISNNFSYLSKFFLVIGLVILSSALKSKEIDKVKIFIISGVLCSIMISIFSIIIYSIDQGKFLFSVGKQVNEVLLTERVYLAFFCVISFIFSLDLLKNKYKKLSGNVFLLINVFLIIIFILLIAARMALISIVIISLYQSLYIQNKKILLSIVFASTIVLVFAFFFNKNLTNRFFYKDQNKTFVENMKVWEPRVVIWQCASDIYKQESFHTLVGLNSFTKTESELLECYENSISNAKKREWFFKQKFNTHNEFFDFLLSFGLIALIFYTLIFIYALIVARKNVTLVSLIISFLLLGLVENYFHRQMGVYLFGLFLILITSQKEYDLINIYRSSSGRRKNKLLEQQKL
ncbi:O-antigen ligase [Aquimarina sp. RZ0]|uniref:O-antigen ligase family protein n=1 Tax=Aquimarina sp. RZ0 TaxID=2607730 RepID=UPI00165F24FA|nr:O-antigen ligase family protein [Aquimarina sp. RZ0]